MFHQLPLPAAALIQALLENSGAVGGGNGGGGSEEDEMPNNISRHELELLQLFGAAAALMDEPWTEGEEGSNTVQQRKDASERDGSQSQEESHRPSKTKDGDKDENSQTKPKEHSNSEDDNENEQLTNQKGASDREKNTGADNQTENDDENIEDRASRPVVKSEIKREVDEEESEVKAHLPKRSNSNSESCPGEQEQSEKGKAGAIPSTSQMMRSMEHYQNRRRSRGSNLMDSSELEQQSSETEEGDDRRSSSRRREQSSGSRRSRTPEGNSRAGSDFGGSPGPFSSAQQHQQQQFLQAGIPYLHLLPPHIRNDAARLFLMPQMLPPELAAAVAASTTITAASNQSPSPGSSSGGGGGGERSANPSQTVIPSSSSTKLEKISAGETSRSGAIYICGPCNIKFSSARTLEAHQTYYCSFRKDAGRVEIEDAKSDLLLPSSSKKRDRESSEEQHPHQHELSLVEESMESIDSSFSLNNNPHKSQKTGKLYSCIYCTYSADKKVSLNRHMRMHSGLSISAATQQQILPSTSTSEHAAIPSTSASSSRPLTPGKSPSGSCSSTSKNLPDNVSAMERYCQDCDIQFSSIKTFRVHKQYYCSTRHVLKAQQTAVAAALAVAAGQAPSAALGKAPVELGPGVTVTPIGKSSASVTSACSPIPGEGSPISTPVPMSSQPFIVLPTNPIIIVPYCFIQGASFLPGNVLPSENAIVVMPNGTVQSLPRGGGGPGSTGSGGMAIPVPSPSPQSLMMGFNPMMHSPFPTSATPGPSNSGIMSPNSMAFPDTKEMIKMMSNANSGSKESLRDEDGMLSPSKIQKHHSRNSGRSSRSSDDAHHQDYRRSHDGGDDGSMPAIDLTFRGIQPKKETISNGGEEEKENHEGGDLCSNIGGRNSRNLSRDSMMGVLEENSRSRSVTPGMSGHHQQPQHGLVHQGSSSAGSHHYHNQRETMSPLEKMSVGSGSGKRTPRPSSASVSSSCSTPPALCEPKLNGMMNHILASGVKDHHEANKMMMMMLNAGAAAALAMEGNNSSSTPGSRAGKSGKNSGGIPVDYSSVLEMTRSPRGTPSSSLQTAGGGKISPLSTQLPGGAILTSATNSQSLAELLMTNPPELNESLAKLNPELLMNAQRAAAAAVAAAAGSPPGFNFNLNPAFMQALSPEIAMRLLDPAYLTSLQQSMQQQQQTSSPQPGPSSNSSQNVKRGVSKCVECDIVFYKYENYLVHKEHYCAARINNNSTPSSSNNLAYPPSKTPTPSASSSLQAKSRQHHRSSSSGNKDAASGACNRMSSCSSPSKSEVDDDESINLPPPQNTLSNQRKNSLTNMNRRSPNEESKPKTNNNKSPSSRQTSPVNISPVASPKGVIITSHHNNNQHQGKNGGGESNQYPCPSCGVLFSTPDNLQTHQAYYCNTNKRKGAVGSNVDGSFADNNGDNKDYCGRGSGNGDDVVAKMAVGLSSPSTSLNNEGRGSNHDKGSGTGACRNGFLRCGKCKLAIPEEQMGTHIRVCLGTVSPSFGNGRGVGGGNGEGVGWKCPCCDVYSPTVSAAQKHLETHTGIRAFKCLLCGYRGNTLRGMRTHIRTHFDKRVFDLLEGDYMTCITANDVEPSATTNANNVISTEHHQNHRAMTSPASGIVNNSKVNNNKHASSSSTRYSPENFKNVNQFLGSGSPSPVSSSGCEIEGGSQGSDIKLFPCPSDMLMMTMMTENESNNPNNSIASAAAENNNQLHHCNLCSYSSAFKASILKHMKVVHKVQIPLDLTAAVEQSEMSLILGRERGAGSKDVEDLNGSGGASSQRHSSDDKNEPLSKNSAKSSALDYALAQGFSLTTSPKSDSTETASASIRSTRRGISAAATSTAVQNGTSGILTKEEASELSIPTSSLSSAERKCSSHSSAEDDIASASNPTPSAIKEINKIIPSQKQSSVSDSTPTGPAASPSPSSTGNYCKSCDISFKHVFSFNAHKKFYCSSQISSDTEASERAETPVQ